MNGTFVLNKISSLATSSASTFIDAINPLWRFLTFSIADDRIYPEKALCVSIEKGLISVAFGSRLFSVIKIKHVKEYPVEEGKIPQPDIFASSLSFAVNEFGTYTKNIILSIPKSWAIVKVVDFPSTALENLSNVVAYELDRITPFNSEDAYYDYKIIGEKEGKISLLVVAARADLINPYLEVANEKGISISKITVNLSVIETLLRYNNNKTEEAFLEINKNGYEGALFINGTILNTFSGNFKTEDHQSKINTIKEQIEPLMQALKIKEKPQKLTVLMTEQDPSFKEIMKIGLPYSIKFLDESLVKIKMQNSKTYSSIGGVIEYLWPKSGGLNLLCKGNHPKTKPPLILTFILIFVILIMWVLYIIAPLRVEKQRLNEIDKQIEMRKEEVKKIEALKKDISAVIDEINLINNFKQDKHMDIDLLKNLTSILPKSAWLSRVRITQTHVELEGYTTESATAILSKLEASPYFKKVEFSSPTFRDTRLKSERFNIKMEIEGLKKEPSLVPKRSTEDEEE